MKLVNIPHHITNPPQFLWWEVDELIPMIVIFGIGFIAMRAIFISLVAMFIVGKLYSKFKQGRHRGYLRHLLYYYGFSKMTNTLTNGLIRLRVG